MAVVWVKSLQRRQQLVKQTAQILCWHATDLPWPLQLAVDAVRALVWMDRLVVLVVVPTAPMTVSPELRVKVARAAVVQVTMRALVRPPDGAAAAVVVLVA